MATVSTKIGGLGGDVGATVSWDDKLIMGLAEDRVKRGIEDATLELERSAKALISEYGGTEGNTSSPGAPPHRVTGELHDDVDHEFRDGGLTGVVGTDLPHGRWLEFGTAKMAARPWLRPALSKIISKIETFFGGSAF